MHQLTLLGPKRLEWLDVPAPQLTSAKAALARPIAVGVCDFDRALVAGRYTALPYPIAVGHEIVAEVIEIGAEVRNVQMGERVVLPLHISCGECASCRAQRTNSCRARPPLSNYGLGARGGEFGGGMSDVLLIPYADAMAAPLPSDLDPIDCAAVGCNLVDLYRSIAPYRAQAAAERVLIVSGAASNMALYGVALARALGLEVDFLDDAAERLAAAEALGARARRLDAQTRIRDLYPVVVDCSGQPERLALALSLVGPDGVCTNVWPHTGAFSLPVGAMFMRNATFITGQPHARALLPSVLDLMQQTGLKSTSIPVETLSWESADRSFGQGEVKRIFVRA